MRIAITRVGVWVCFVLCLSCWSANAQEFEYRVGSGEVSIEPGSEFVSLSLAGYAAPREGRYTLEWIREYELTAHFSDFISFKGRFYFLKDGDVWSSASPLNLYVSLTQVTVGADFSVLTSSSEGLYAVNRDGELFVSKKHRKTLRWNKIADMGRYNPVAITRYQNGFVLVSEDGKVVETDILGRETRLLTTHADVIIDLVEHNGRLHALATSGEIVQYQTDGTWLRVAYPNGITYSQDIRHLAVRNGQLYALGANREVYRVQHNTTGQLVAGAVSIRKDTDRVIVIRLDLCGFDADFIADIKDEIQEKYGIPHSAVLINASHTHFAPVTQRWTTWGDNCQKPDTLYLYGTVREGIHNAVREAVKSEKQANLYFGRGNAEIGLNRNLKGDNLPYDSDVDVLKIAYKNQSESDVLYLAGCHPVFNAAGKEGVTITANYPGESREQLVHHSRIRRAFFVQGCGGDINPKNSDHKITANILATEVVDVLEGGQMSPIRGDVTHYLDTVHFKTNPWEKAKLLAFKAENETKKGDIVAERDVRWANLMLAHYRDGTMPATMPVYVQTINIGDWKLVGLSRETTTEYSLGIKQLWPDKKVTVAGYSNDVSSYLPTSRHINARIYEGEGSFFWYGQPNVFPVDVYETIIDAVKTKNR